MKKIHAEIIGRGGNAILFALTWAFFISRKIDIGLIFFGVWMLFIVIWFITVKKVGLR